MVDTILLNIIEILRRRFVFAQKLVDPSIYICLPGLKLVGLVSKLDFKFSENIALCQKKIWAQRQVTHKPSRHSLCKIFQFILLLFIVQNLPQSIFYFVL